MNLNLGFIGLGNMGLPMSLRAAAALPGRVWVTARSEGKARPLLDAGAHWAATPRVLASKVDVLLVMLPDLPQLEDMLGGPEGIVLGAQQQLAEDEGRPVTIVVSSTCSAPRLRQLACSLEQVSGKGLKVVDAPVSGGVEGAADGSLVIMVGGDGPVVQPVLPLLATMGHPVHLGPLGAGQVAKACNQLVVASTIVALGEAAELAENSGIDPAQLFELLGGGYAGSRILETRKQRLAQQHYEPGGKASYMAKDLSCAVEAAGSMPLDLLMNMRRWFDGLVKAGLGDEDIAVTRKYTARRAHGRS